MKFLDGKAVLLDDEAAVVGVGVGWLIECSCESLDEEFQWKRKDSAGGVMIELCGAGSSYGFEPLRFLTSAREV